MGEVVIKADEISKLYKLGEVSSGTLANDLKRKWAKLRDKEDPLKKIGEINDREIKGNGDLVWALKDVSFSIKQGEVIGFVGRNGAGKSTLLKILSRITKPTSGRIGIRGRIASLLEVGTGFHPELTGRENIFLNGAILGMSKTEIRNKLDEIVDFSGVTRYIDTPVKRYSSGMYVRLAFAVAAHLEPEILIIDEVLSVGDAEFQKRCLGKIRDVSENDGRTVLFVSHDMNAISTLTQRAILMERGRINLIGKTSDVINSYLSFNSRKDPVYFGAPSDSQPQITRVELFTSLPNNHHVCLAPLAVEIDLHTPHALKGASLSFQVINNREQAICHVWTFDSERPMCRQKGAYQLRCEIPVSRIYMGDYSLKVYFSGPPGGPVYQIVEKACPFTVEMFEMEREFQWYPGTCTYLEDAEWDIQTLDN